MFNAMIRRVPESLPLFSDQTGHLVVGLSELRWPSGTLPPKIFMGDAVYDRISLSDECAMYAAPGLPVVELIND